MHSGRSSSPNASLPAPRRGPRFSPRRPTTFVVAGVASLANATALLLHIVGGLPLPGLLAATWTTAILAIAVIAGTADASTRGRMARWVAVAIAVGIVATLAYDATKAFLAQLDPSPYDPFETTRVFGRILVGASAPAGLVAVVGWGFHLMNGATFAVAFGLLFARGGRISRRRAVATGIGWGLFLESFQLALYPGWLSIGFIDEFRRISFMSHVVFGALLGLLVPAGLRWTDRRAALGTGGVG